MGVDSGLPDFRGTSGFWKAYPPLAKLGIQFEDMANPRWFKESPNWHGGLRAPAQSLPHDRTQYGFSLLLKWTREQNLSSFVFTSNVDGHFQRSGFSRIRSPNAMARSCILQCVDQCGQEMCTLPPDRRVKVDQETLHDRDPLPAFPRCGGLARPNIIMFSDWEWDPRRTNEQGIRLNEWLEQNEEAKLCIIELGAGPNIPTVRTTCEQAWHSSDGTFLRINPRDHQVPEGLFLLPWGQGGTASDRRIQEGGIRAFLG